MQATKIIRIKKPSKQRQWKAQWAELEMGNAFQEQEYKEGQSLETKLQAVLKGRPCQCSCLPTCRMCCWECQIKLRLVHRCYELNVVHSTEPVSTSLISCQNSTKLAIDLMVRAWLYCNVAQWLMRPARYPWLMRPAWYPEGPGFKLSLTLNARYEHSIAAIWQFKWSRPLISFNTASYRESF